MQRPLLHLNWVLEQEWLQPASSLLSPQSLSGGEGEKERVEDGVSRTTSSVTPAWPTRPSFPPTAHPTPTEKNNKQKSHRNCIDRSMHHGPQVGGGGRAPGGPTLESQKAGGGGILFSRVWEQGLLTSGGPRQRFPWSGREWRLEYR